MNTSKTIEFLRHIYTKTRNGELDWIPLYEDKNLQSIFKDLLPNFSFYTMINNGVIVIGSLEFPDNLTVEFQPLNKPVYNIFSFIDFDEEDSDSAYSYLNRIYDLISSNNSPADDFVDAFLQS